MPKQKTKKAARKRFQVTSTGKLRRLKTRRAHFNARATGDETRGKHREQAVDASDAARVARLLPYT